MKIKHKKVRDKKSRDLPMIKEGPMKLEIPKLEGWEHTVNRSFEKSLLLLDGVEQYIHDSNGDAELLSMIKDLRYTIGKGLMSEENREKKKFKTICIPTAGEDTYTYNVYIQQNPPLEHLTVDLCVDHEIDWDGSK